MKYTPVTKDKPYSAAEMKFVADNPKMPVRELARKLNRSYDSVMGQRHRIKHGVTKKAKLYGYQTN